MLRDFSDATLVLVGHGSTANRHSSAPVYQHARELRRRRLFVDVRECFWKEPPFIRDALPGVLTPRVFVVPLFISDGYFTEEIIPRELGLSSGGPGGFDRIQRRGHQTVFYGRPVGSHPSMTGVLLARAREVVTSHPFPAAPKPGESALFIAGHGTERNENSRRAIERQVEAIRVLDHYAEVHAVFLEEEPRIADCYRMARARNLVMVPFFMSDGLHTREDIPVLLGESESVVRTRLRQAAPPWRNPTEKHGKRVWYAPAIGSEPHLADVILERVEEVAGGSPDD